MRITLLLCMLLIALILGLRCVSASQPQEQRTVDSRAKLVKNKPEWQAGTYRGLTVGKSKRADVLSVFGQPERVDTPPDQEPTEPTPEVWYVYPSGGGFLGRLTVVLDERTDVVLGIDVSPEELSKEEAVKHFGKDYILTRYNFDTCLGNEESAPLYESADGPVLEIEYRHRGIAIAVNQDGRVNTISYVSKPIGARESKCDALNQNATRRNQKIRPPY